MTPEEIARVCRKLLKERDELREDQRTVETFIQRPLIEQKRKAAASVTDSSVPYALGRDPHADLEEAQATLAAVAVLLESETRDATTLPKAIERLLPPDSPRVAHESLGRVFSWPRCLRAGGVARIEEIDRELEKLAEELARWKAGPGPKRRRRIGVGRHGFPWVDGKPGRVVGPGAIVELDDWEAESPTWRVDKLTVVEDDDAGEPPGARAEHPVEEGASSDSGHLASS